MNAHKTKTTSLVLAIIISLAFLGLTIPHSAEVLSQFEKPGSWLPWLCAVGLEFLVAYAMFVVCEPLYPVWVKALAGVIVTIAIIASFILNFAHYLSINSNPWYAAGLAALLPGLVALLGAMLPGLMADKPTETLVIPTPPPAPQVDPWPIMQAALEAMERRIGEGMEASKRELATAVASLPELVARTVEAQLPTAQMLAQDENDQRATAQQRRKLGQSNKDIALALNVPLRTVQNWNRGIEDVTKPS